MSDIKEAFEWLKSRAKCPASFGRKAERNYTLIIQSHEAQEKVIADLVIIIEDGAECNCFTADTGYYFCKRCEALKKAKAVQG